MGPSGAFLDPVIHQPARLGLLGMLRAADEVEFRLVRDELGISDSSLSQHVTVLESAGLVSVRKGAVGRRPRTWLALTDAGRQALENYVDQIRRLAGDREATKAGGT